MKPKFFFGSALMVLSGLAAAPVCSTSLAAESAVGITSSRSPADLARADRGARLEVFEAGKTVSAAPAQTLIGNDVAQGYALNAGTTSMILSPAEIEVVNHFDFVNAGGAGAVTVSVSSVKLPVDSADWREVVAGQAFEGRQLIPCDLGSVEARYIKLISTSGQPATSTALTSSGWRRRRPVRWATSTSRWPPWPARVWRPASRWTPRIRLRRWSPISVSRVNSTG